ncbi:Tubulin-tyrosine ligase family protein [Tritrichomonas foetus]|uniref:Tubulin-tyrosine ligase family protein n=1 Tax=Tritrichomonas foetus TaxID=1144522 RepID=A0A1J4K5C0_9EUKA|nr:Tubulin-tyrosine ligase family protein [Tritrichomonas foetus]|eukprot:OHT06395.1 Tubulin-tyrosine ligase family protein [Tritrichomonas foetus]
MDYEKILQASEGRILYLVVKDAFRKALIKYSMAKNDRAILVWYDTIKDGDYFSTLQPWQVVNRLPSINLICRKTPFVRLINRIQPFFPKLYTFLPKSYILPIQNAEFQQMVLKHDKKYIVKSDNGSLGLGISIISPSMSYEPVTYLAVAQEYVESCLVDSTKFDCRIYVLIASINPLKVYIYRGGVARFCSMASGSDSIYSQLTNTAVNKQNTNVTIDQITRMVTDVFERLKSQGADIDLLWKKIDQAIVLTILSAYEFLSQDEAKKCPNCGYSRCFQILGFDVLIDEKYDPIILEVNYRPSLETDTDAEKAMKAEMLSEAMLIACPLTNVQKIVINTKIEYNNEGWRNFIKANSYIMEDVNKQLNANLKASHFVQAYPCEDSSIMSEYKAVLAKVKTLPIGVDEKFKLPVEYVLNTSNSHPESLPPLNPNNTLNNSKENPPFHVKDAPKPIEKTYMSHQKSFLPPVQASPIISSTNVSQSTSNSYMNSTNGILKSVNHPKRNVIRPHQLKLQPKSVFQAH